MNEPVIIVGVVAAAFVIFFLLAVGNGFFLRFIVRVVREELAGQRTDL